MASPTAKTCDRYRPTHRHSLVQVKISLNEYLDHTDQLRLEARHFVYAQEVSRFPREVALDLAARGFRSPGVVEDTGSGGAIRLALRVGRQGHPVPATTMRC